MPQSVVLVVAILGCGAPEARVRPPPAEPTPTEPVDTGGAPVLAPLPLCLNELMADNRSVLADETGAYPDWIELHNPTDAAVPLDGWTLTDDPDDPFQHALSGEVPAGGFVVFYADGRPELGDAHLSFSLAATGEEVGLFAPDGRGTIVAYDAVESDLALARVPDCCVGEGCWAPVVRGSPAATNDLRLVERALVSAGATWRSWDGVGRPEDGWDAVGFDDAAWPEGPAPVGFGGDEVTTLANADQPMQWLRHTFEIAPVEGEGPVSARIELRRDDGAIVRLDGVEVVRDNVLEGTDPGLTAEHAVEGAEEVVWFDHDLDPALLTPGTHTLAVELRQALPDGDDLLLDLALVVQEWSAP